MPRSRGTRADTSSSRAPSAPRDNVTRRRTWRPASTSASAQVRRLRNASCSCGVSVALPGESPNPTAFRPRTYKCSLHCGTSRATRCCLRHARRAPGTGVTRSAVCPPGTTLSSSSRVHPVIPLERSPMPNAGRLNRHPPLAHRSRPRSTPVSRRSNRPGDHTPRRRGRGRSRRVADATTALLRLRTRAVARRGPR